MHVTIEASVEVAGKRYLRVLSHLVYKELLHASEASYLQHSDRRSGTSRLQVDPMCPKYNLEKQLYIRMLELSGDLIS